MFFLLKIETKDKNKKKKLAIKKQQELLKKHYHELLIMHQQRKTTVKQTEWMINHYHKRHDISNKRWQCVRYHLYGISRQLEKMINEQQWVTANEHEYIDQAKKYWAKELSVLKDELFLFEQDLCDLRQSLNHHLAHVEGIQRGLLCMKKEYYRLDLILDQLNNDNTYIDDGDYYDEKKKKRRTKNKKKNKENYNNNERSSFSFMQNSYNSPSTTSSSTYFIYCLLRSKIVPCSSIK